MGAGAEGARCGEGRGDTQASVAEPSPIWRWRILLVSRCRARGRRAQADPTLSHHARRRIEEHYKSNGVMPMSVLKQDARAALYLKLQLPVRTQPPRRSSTSGPTLRRPFPPDTRAYVVHHFTPNLTTSTKSPVQPNLVHKCDDKVIVDHLRETTRAWSVIKHDEKVRRSPSRRDASRLELTRPFLSQLRATDLHPSFIATLDAAGQASSSANASAYGSASTAASPSTTAPTTAGPSAAASAAPGPSALSLLGAKIPLPKFLWPRAKRDVVKADK